MHPPNGYITLAEAWPEWLSRRFPKTSKHLFDPATYRPNAIGGHWNHIGPDSITGEYRLDPEQRIKDNALTVPDHVAGECRFYRPSVEIQFWELFCRKNTDVANAITVRDGVWQALHHHEWVSICEKLLWRKVVAEDPGRTDWGPKKWMVLAMGKNIPSHVAVHREAFSGILAEGRSFSDFSISEIVVRPIETTSEAGKVELSSTKKGIFSAREVRNWLEALITAGPKAFPKAEYFKQAAQKFSVSKKAFEEIWSTAIDSKNAPDWRKPGAPKGPRKSSRR